jgi:hypothetical protein
LSLVLSERGRYRCSALHQSLHMWSMPERRRTGFRPLARALCWRVCVHTRARVNMRNRGCHGEVGAAPMKARRNAMLSTSHTA